MKAQFTNGSAWRVLGLAGGLAAGLLGGTVAAAEVRMEKVNYGGWPNCLKLTDGKVELIATTDVGPRIIRLAFVGEKNLLKEWPDQLGKTGGQGFRGYGGHRMWHAPEDPVRTYVPDNGPVAHAWSGRVLTLTPPVEPPTGLQKEWEVGLDGSSSAITIVHRLINRGPQAVEAAPWALTVVPGPGRAIVPQEPYVPHAQRLLPARTVTLWAYTDMRDSRYTWGTKFVQVRCDPAIGRSQKIGFMNTPGWMAYWREGNLLVKRMAFDPRATYPDLGANTEVYTGGDMLELETLGPLGKLEPGAKVEHVERWYLFKTQCGEDEAAMEKILLPLIQATEPVKP